VELLQEFPMVSGSNPSGAVEISEWLSMGMHEAPLKKSTVG
jgi:hypothetical protein